MARWSRRAGASWPSPPARATSRRRARAYDAVDRIDWPGGFCRRDIGWRAIARGTGAA
jgi:phosphoribosylamine--glycine ligase